MSADELHEHAAEGKRHVDDQPIFVAAEIEDDPVVAQLPGRIGSAHRGKAQQQCCRTKPAQITENAALDHVPYCECRAECAILFART